MRSGSAISRYGFAVLIVLGALGVRLALNPALGPNAPYLPFVVAIILVARVGGRGPGYAAAVFSTILTAWFFLEPRYSLTVSSLHPAMGVAVFLITALLIALLVGNLQEARLASARVEKALRLQVQLVDLSHDAIITMNSERRVTAWNFGAQEMYGWTESEVLGMVIHDLLQTREPVSEIDAVLNRAGRWEGELNHLARDGRRLRVESRHVMLRDEQNRPVGILEINRDITEKSRAQETLHRSEAKLRAIFRSLSEGLLLLNPQGRIEDANDAIARAYGQTVEQFTDPQLDPRSRVIRSDGTPFPLAEQPAIVALQTGQGVREVEMGIPAPDGTIGWKLVNAQPVRDDEGTLLGAVASFFDITERKRAEEALRDSEQRFRALVEQASDAFFLHDRQGRFVDVNQRACESLGYSREELLSTAVFDVERDFDLPKAQQAWAQIQVGEAVTLYGHQRRKDGSEFPVEARLSPCMVAGERLILGLVRDITERQRMEQALRESEQQYRALFEAMQEAFAVGEIICDPAGKPVDWRYLDVNPAFESMFGRKRPEAVGRTYRELFPDAPWEYWVSALGEVALTGRPAHLEQYGSDEGRHYEAIAYSPRPGRFAAVFTDVTGRKQAEERLRHTQKLESIGLLAAGVAHDFNNLLTVIMGSASSALEQCPSCEHNQAIVSAADRAAHLTRQLLAYAGKGQYVTKAVDVSHVVAGSRQLIEASVPKRVNLVFHLANHLPCIEEDPSRVEQILMNLVINAGEAILPKTDGRLEIATGSAEITPEIARQQARYEVAAGRYVWLEVRDNGAGMDETTLARVFDPFFSTKFTGRGLGLAAVDGIVRSSKGFIEVRSSPGAGATFCVFLPASEIKQPPEVAAPVPPQRFRVASSVLVVDDEDMVRRLANIILTRHGYEVLEAADGRQALQVLTDSPTLPSAVLLDLAMPVMGGDELVPILAQHYPDLKIVISSGYPEEEARKVFPAAIVAGYLQKPYRAIALTEKIDEILGRLVQFPESG